MEASNIATALGLCDWSGACIGNKALITSAIEVLNSQDALAAEAERLRGIIDRMIVTSKLLAEKSPSTPWGDGYKECAVATCNALEDMLRLEGKA